ncbi:MAG TPA: RimK/LysX family protein [Candidatus Saccharimonadales bacterium]|nr:RimK/LysX family protein [Candidatus Saccharimonadales bacterium]
MTQGKNLTAIGRVERINLPSLGAKKVPAKVDTGADASSIWCSKITLTDDGLKCVFFDKSSPFYTGQRVYFKNSEVDLTRIANSFGQKELRYKVKIPIEIKKRTIKATFTLTDRSTKLYPILIGRSTLQGKFLVDVSRGTPLHEEEGQRQRRLRREMRRIKKKLSK